ncbi:DUF962 domain-containing protein [Candidatus Marinimicrobia bacterium]|nr:DUF962 domain-containing protein [Candidatus Neomarinimicrobiota bacterium]
MKTNKFNSFSEFYPFYLSEHKKNLTKIYHMIGSLTVISLIIFSIYSTNYKYLCFTPIAGYGFAWYSHFFIENNKPATFKYPLYSFIGDWIMFKDIITGKIKL